MNKIFIFKGQIKKSNIPGGFIPFELMTTSNAEEQFKRAVNDVLMANEDAGIDYNIVISDIEEIEAGFFTRL